MLTDIVFFWKISDSSAWKRRSSVYLSSFRDDATCSAHFSAVSCICRFLNVSFDSSCCFVDLLISSCKPDIFLWRISLLFNDFLWNNNKSNKTRHKRNPFMICKLRHFCFFNWINWNDFHTVWVQFVKGFCLLHFCSAEVWISVTVSTVLI